MFISTFTFYRSYVIDLNQSETQFSHLWNKVNNAKKTKRSTWNSSLRLTDLDILLQSACPKYLFIFLLGCVFLNDIFMQVRYKTFLFACSVQFSSVFQSCMTLCDSMDCSTPALPVQQQHPELAQTHVHWVGDVIQLPHSLSSPSPPIFNLSQHQCPFQWVSSLHQLPKELEFQLQHQSFQLTFRTDLL